MKRLYLLVLILSAVLVLLLTGCSQDGENYVYIPYESSEGEIHYIEIKDTFNRNGIMINETNMEVYCQKGPDDIVYLPEETESASDSTAKISISATEICDKGQEGLDGILSNFKIVPKP